MLLSVISAIILDMCLFQDSFNLLLILDIEFDVFSYGARVLYVCTRSALSLAQLSVTTFGGVEKENFLFVRFFCNNRQTGRKQNTIKALIKNSRVTQKCRGWRWFDANCRGRRLLNAALVVLLCVL
jgi:hypothetical protein